MLRRLAETARPPMRWFVLVLFTIAIVLLLCWIDDDPPVAPASAPFEVHIKLRVEEYRMANRGLAATPLFTHLPPGVHDARTRWIRVTVASRAEMARLAEDPAVEAIVQPAVVSLPSTQAPLRADPSCPLKTPRYESYQGYLGPAPAGIDAVAAWQQGYAGKGEWFADVEGNWNAKHEDLPTDRIEHVAGERVPARAWLAHGTAVLGEVVGRDNGKGVIGIAPDVERVFTASIGGLEVADAIDAAAEALRPGDVLLIELQTGGPRGRYVPVEYFDDIFDAITAATARGVVVIEAAGNGGEDLDHTIYKRKFDRTKRDSGAIFVGAGGPTRPGFVDRERLDFSNYGSRVDVQGWGRKVATLDYGDLQSCDGPSDRDYTDEFSGTSSASPIIAGAALILEGRARSRGRLLSPAEIRALLASTGTPQTGDRGEWIGPRPDLAAALAIAATAR